MDQRTKSTFEVTRICLQLMPWVHVWDHTIKISPSKGIALHQVID